MQRRCVAVKDANVGQLGTEYMRLYINIRQYILSSFQLLFMYLPIQHIIVFDVYAYFLFWLSIHTITLLFVVANRHVNQTATLIITFAKGNVSGN